MLKDKLKELRENNGAKQRELALILGITTSCYSNYEQETREPSIDIIKKICDYYDIDTDVLLEYKKPSDRNYTIVNTYTSINNGKNKGATNRNFKGNENIDY